MEAYAVVLSNPSAAKTVTAALKSHLWFNFISCAPSWPFLPLPAKLWLLVVSHLCQRYLSHIRKKLLGLRAALFPSTGSRYVRIIGKMLHFYDFKITFYHIFMNANALSCRGRLLVGFAGALVKQNANCKLQICNKNI